jgi:hypothetical protein
MCSCGGNCKLEIFSGEITSPQHASPQKPDSVKLNFETNIINLSFNRRNKGELKYNAWRRLLAIVCIFI